ncbi:hypothetical protein [Kitasatospora sp. NPDC047058]|uniref:hypothetical protein n=1 Tax=Kitasatospora sp. NPDC047058 TaxID=3155620 RepID=UPI0033EA2602
MHAERIADAATACAIRLAHGAQRPDETTVRGLLAAVATVADALDAPLGPADAPQDAPPGGPAVEATLPANCRTLHDIATELHGIHERGLALAGAGA